jgi:hypothetical protein
MGDLVQTASGMKMAGMNYVRLEMKGVYQSHSLIQQVFTAC